MNYETQYHFRDYPITKTAQTASSAQSARRVRKMDAKTKGCKRSVEGQTEVCSNSHADNAFLKHSFLPVLSGFDEVVSKNYKAKLERDFYKSLSRLAEHYDLQPIQTDSFDYPYNIALALDIVNEQLKNKEIHWEHTRIIQEKGKTYLVTDERFSSGSFLFYIPIIPLFRLSKDHQRRKTALLLQSVCSYLYHIVGVPYFRNGDSYLFYMYDMLSDWALDDETEDTSIYFHESKKAHWIGDFVESKIYNYENLTRFGERLNHFKIKDNFDKECFKIAKEAHSLFQQYPNESIFRNARFDGEIEEDEMEYTVTMDRYISFCADTKGLLYDSLFSCVNNELQEYKQIEEPAIVNIFDGRENSKNTLDFEKRVFDLIDDLIYILNNV